MNKLVLFFFLSILAFGVFAQEDVRPYVVLVSFDGFRYDYVDKYDLPNFKKMIEEGTSAEAMIPSFPSKTFPNHYTLVTGLYPGNHGLVDNAFYDSVTNEFYASKKKDLVQNRFYYGGTPLWQLVQKHGMKSASYFWIGSEANVAGSYPDHFEIYNQAVPNIDRIGAVMKWLKMPVNDRPHFISLYFSVIDNITHEYGPDSPEAKEALLHADDLLGEIRREIAQLDFPVNLIVVSDHGMYPMENGQEKYIDILKKFTLPEESVQVVNNGSHIHLYCTGHVRDSLYQLAVARQDHYQVYLRGNTPQEWHYNNNYRIGDILFVAEPGYTFTKNTSDNPGYGSHGYDPYCTSEMKAIFYASGPDIKQNYAIPEFQNIHVYPLIAYLLGIEVTNIDGSLDVLKNIVIEKH